MPIIFSLNIVMALIIEFNAEGAIVIDPDTGVGTQFDTYAQAAAFVAASGQTPGTPEVPAIQQGNELVDLNTGEVYGIDTETGFLDNGALLRSPEDLNNDLFVPDDGLLEFTPEGSIVRQPEEVSETALYGTPFDDDGNLNPGWELDGDGNPFYRGYSQGRLWVNPNTQASAEASRELARQQQTIAQQRRQINNGDWRVRLRLAPNSQYLYKAPRPGILAPLADTDGIIFPYTPSITMNYRANYSQYDLTHNNYRGYFYTNSAVEPVNLTAQFTAQDTTEANYLLAVIHFLRSVTKMFYGNDPQRGSPPPLVYLTGLGEYQFNEHSCLVSSFSYNLPADVDYIRAGSVNQLGTDLTTRRPRQQTPINGLAGTVGRLANAFLNKGAIPNPPAPATLGLNRPTYVPTKIEIQITLLPVQSRQQVSKQFSLESFANGNLLKGGFW